MIAIENGSANGPGVGDCWNRIGVNGDGTCPELKVHVHCRNCPIFARAARGFFERRAPEGYLAEWANLLGRPVERGTTDSASLLVFRLGREWLAMALSVVAEVTDLRPVHRVPHRTNRVFSGLVSLRGQLQLCVSMYGLLEVDPPDPSDEPSTNPRLVVIQHLPRNQLEKVPSTLSNPAGSFSRAVFAWGHGRSVDVLDEPRVFEALRRIGR
jgi:chemotaxis-related protein WspD